ncbi:hypothetical protein FGAF138_37220 [Escherichia coli]|nr:hypothetical protein FGAF138_37220 [Escherichia coli]
MALEDASTTKKGIVQLSSATNSTSETLAATPKAVKSAYDNAEKRLQKDQNGADIPDKGRFLNNINAVSKTDFADKRGMRYVRVAASLADVLASLADFFAAAVFCATTDALRATSSTISSKRRSASGRASSSVMAPRKSFSVPG